MGSLDPIAVVSILYKMGDKLVNDYMNYPRVKSFLQSDESFDVCIIEIFNADAFVVSIKPIFAFIETISCKYFC